MPRTSLTARIKRLFSSQSASSQKPTPPDQTSSAKEISTPTPAAKESAKPLPKMPGDAYQAALEHNAEWCTSFTKSHGELMANLAKTQHPEILWIGCADSRVPETTLLGLNPGDVFVHRNIANLLHPGDLSSQAVIEYAVVHLKVKHIILCGHTGCGGVAASLGGASLGVLDAWLMPLRLLREKFASELTGDDQAKKLGEISVKEGVKNLLHNGNVIKAVEAKNLVVHGVIYDVGTGKLKEIHTSETEEERKKRLEYYQVS
ncbi:MAG: carbonic anhydrase [Vezdaea aestivalis]|nr:MAG: carbonic anhydrase [Vezdaea aestivalis]